MQTKTIAHPRNGDRGEYCENDMLLASLLDLLIRHKDFAHMPDQNGHRSAGGFSSAWFSKYGRLAVSCWQADLPPIPIAEKSDSMRPASSPSNVCGTVFTQPEETAPAPVPASVPIADAQAAGRRPTRQARPARAGAVPPARAGAVPISRRILQDHGLARTAAAVSDNPEPCFNGPERAASGAERLLRARQWITRVNSHNLQQALNPRRFSRLHNIGGGDCLFHALHGTPQMPNLNAEQIAAVRRDVAAILEDEPDTPASTARNGYQLMSGRQQAGVAGWVQSPQATNRNMAQFQRTPGTPCGNMELKQWLRLPENRALTVVVLDALNGQERVDIFTPPADPRTQEVTVHNGLRPSHSSIDRIISPETFREAVDTAIYGVEPNDASRRDRIPSDRIILYRTASHFERVTDVHPAA